jgi:hypothetical protein
LQKNTTIRIAGVANATGTIRRDDDPIRRDQQQNMVENVINMATRQIPSNRLGWRPLFANCFTLLVDMYDINYNNKSESLARGLVAPCG